MECANWRAGRGWRSEWRLSLYLVRPYIHPTSFSLVVPFRHVNIHQPSLINGTSHNMASEAAVDPARPAGRDGADTPTRTPDRDAADDFDADLVSDLHDCFGMMYAGSEWDSDDEVSWRVGDWQLPIPVDEADGRTRTPSCQQTASTWYVHHH